MAKIEDIVSDEVLTSFSTETPSEQAVEPRTPRILNVPGAAVGRTRAGGRRRGWGHVRTLQIEWR